MPIPVPPDAPAPRGPAKRGFHLPGREPYARATERRSHEEAIFAFGEYALFVLMWNIEDFKAGRVERCSRCQDLAGATDEASALIFDTFKAPAEDLCPNCYGTTFEGGWKARIVRASLWDTQDESTDEGARGIVKSMSASVQTTHDFRLRSGDAIIRVNGSRWRAAGGLSSPIRDGFGMPTRADSNLGFNYTKVSRDERTTKLIEPLTRTEAAALLEHVGHWPMDTTPFDQIRGPLLTETNEYAIPDYRPTDDLPGSPTTAP